MQTIAQNKKALFDYKILEKFETGIELSGQEVKSAKFGGANIVGAYMIIRGGEAFLINTSITPYQPKNAPTAYDPLRPRRLLLNKKEIEYLAVKSNEGGLTIIPLSLYNKKGLLKLEVGLAKHKKTFDKRNTLQKRESKIKIERTLKNY